MKLDSAPQLPECIEGPEAFRWFDEGLRQILSVPHSTLVRRERAYKQKSLANPKRLGPKPKVLETCISQVYICAEGRFTTAEVRRPWRIPGISPLVGSRLTYRAVP